MTSSGTRDIAIGMLCATQTLWPNKMVGSLPRFDVAVSSTLSGHLDESHHRYRAHVRSHHRFLNHGIRPTPRQPVRCKRMPAPKRHLRTIEPLWIRFSSLCQQPRERVQGRFWHGRLLCGRIMFIRSLRQQFWRHIILRNERVFPHELGKQLRPSATTHSKRYL